MNKEEFIEDDQGKNEKSKEQPFVRQRQTRPSNKFRLKRKMMADPKMRKDEVILLDSDCSPSEVHEGKIKRKQQTGPKIEKAKFPVHERKDRKKAKSSSEHELVKGKLSAEDVEILKEAGCNLDDPSVIIPKELKQTSQKTSSSVKEKASRTETKISGKQSTIQEQKGKYKTKILSEENKLKRRLFEDDKFDEVLEEPDQKEIQYFIASTEMLSSGDCKEHKDLQKQKGKGLYIENLAEGIRQIETEEKAKKNEQSLKQKVKEWMLVLDEEKRKGKDGKATRVYKRLIDMGHLAEELTWIVEKAMETGTPAMIEDARDTMKAKKRKDHHS
jgi:hypothetical protein